MRLVYYGTAAGAGIPEIFCSCPVCSFARSERGKDIRTRSQAVLDGELSIDYPVDVLMHTIHGGLDMRSIKHVLITHNHHDHFLADDVLSRPQGVEGAVHFYLSEGSGASFKKKIELTEEAYNSGKRIRTSNFRVEAHTMEFYSPLKIPNYDIIPLPARHAEAMQAMNFIISKGGKNILWAHDTGFYPDEVWEFIKKSGIRFDLVSLDCTLKRGERITKSHMDLDLCIEAAERLRAQGNADEKTKFVLSHIGHLVERTHARLCAEAEPYGFTVAYDGMEIEF